MSIHQNFLTALLALSLALLPSIGAAKAIAAPAKSSSKKITVLKTATTLSRKKTVTGVAKSRLSRVAYSKKTVILLTKRRTNLRVRQVAFVPSAPPRLSMAQLQGLHGMRDPLELQSSVALVADQLTGEVLFSKNDHAVLPIASITKLMTALVTLEARLPLTDSVLIGDEDIDQEKNSRSRLRIGTQLSRAEALHLALMASENRAAHALSRHYPGGTIAFVRAMNTKAQSLGMQQTVFKDPTGLSSNNLSSAHDLATLMRAAYEQPNIRQWSTSQELSVDVLGRVMTFSNTNRLTQNPDWDIGLQKTGFIAEAGKCLVMQARIEGRAVLMVFLDSAGKYDRLADAQRVRAWLASGGLPLAPQVANKAT